MTEKDFLKTLDKLSKHYGFGENISKVKDLKITEGTTSIGPLDGFSLEDSTPAFLDYSRNHILFLDTYFRGKPHGQYAHIMQWLYLAERFSQPAQNVFGKSLLNALFTDVQAYAMEDFLAGVIVTDFVGQRAPQNPDHINNLLQFFVPVE